MTQNSEQNKKTRNNNRNNNRSNNKEKLSQTALSATVEPEIATEQKPAEEMTEVTVTIQSILGGSITVDEIIAVDTIDVKCG